MCRSHIRFKVAHRPLKLSKLISNKWAKTSAQLVLMAVQVKMLLHDILNREGKKMNECEQEVSTKLEIIETEESAHQKKMSRRWWWAETTITSTEPLTTHIVFSYFLITRRLYYCVPCETLAQEHSNCLWYMTTTINFACIKAIVYMAAALYLPHQVIVYVIFIACVWIFSTLPCLCKQTGWCEPRSSQ